ncbi:hypothetical protein [Pseudomonas mosselii]|uniref:hypothetical protein n=1 Tax=Pseudomonas mosselii TaxID=78327 RepID=UPI00117A695E|nr:hypothetical protein [Pseudomonas mosselii]
MPTVKNVAVHTKANIQNWGKDKLKALDEEIAKEPLKAHAPDIIFQKRFWKGISEIGNHNEVQALVDAVVSTLYQNTNIEPITLESLK